MHPSLAKAAPTPSPTSCDLFLGELPPPVRALRRNHTLFGRLTSGRCAESLSYGPVPLHSDDHDHDSGDRGDAYNDECAAVFQSEPGFLSTFDADAWHDEFWQLVLPAYPESSPSSSSDSNNATTASAPSTSS